MSKAEELRSKSVDELVKLVLELRKDQLNMRFQKAQGALEKTDGVRKNRRQLALIKTILTEKRKEEAKASSGKKAA